MYADQTVVHQGNYTEHAERINKLWKWISRLFIGLPDMQSKQDRWGHNARPSNYSPSTNFFGWYGH